MFSSKNVEDRKTSWQTKIELADCFGQIENKAARPKTKLPDLNLICQNGLLEGWELSF